MRNIGAGVMEWHRAGRQSVDKLVYQRVGALQHLLRRALGGDDAGAKNENTETDKSDLFNRDLGDDDDDSEKRRERR